MLNEALGIWVGIVSHGRAANVAMMQGKVGPATWYLGNGEAKSYLDAGASSVVESGNLPTSINCLLESANNHHVPCVRLDDDLKSIKRILEKDAVVVVTFADAITILLSELNGTGFKLAGVAPTTNPFYYDPKKQLTTNGFIIGSFSVVMPCSIRVDPSLLLKEDYDFTIQHILRYGGVARRNDLLADFAHYTNAGGVVEMRNAETEAAAINRLKQKWPGIVADNPRRPNEILLRLR